MSNGLVTSSEKIDFLKKAFGEIGYKDSKGNIQFKCPKCLRENAKLGLPLNKYKFCVALHKNMIFHCWVCGYNGHLAKALKEYSTQNLLVEYLKKFADYKSYADSSENKDSVNKFQIPSDFRILATHLNSQDPSIKKGIEYAYKRGLTEKDLWYFKVGISDEFPWNRRLIFPSFNAKGELDCLLGRSWDHKPKFKYYDQAKVLKKFFVFNEINIDWTKTLTITEGPMDLVKCDENATILLGSDVISRDSYLFAQIVKHNTPIVLAIDPDMSYTKMPKIVEKFLSVNIEVRVINFGSYSDVGEMTKEIFQQKKDKATKWNNMSILRNKISSINSKFII